MVGIEPTYLAWKANVLPLNYTRMAQVFTTYVLRYRGGLQKNQTLRQITRTARYG